MTTDIKGVLPALITPFHPDGSLAADKLKTHVEWLADRVNGLFVCGSYGSGPLMTPEERRRVAEVCRAAMPPNSSLIVHVGAPDTGSAVALTKHANDIGATAVAAVTPFYYRHSEPEIRRYFEALVSTSSVPVLAYNNPKYSNFSIDPPLMRQLMEDGLMGVKDSSGDINLFSSYVSQSPASDRIFLIGSQTLLLHALVAGGHGCVSGLSNALPELVQNIYTLGVAGDFTRARESQERANLLREITGSGIPVPFYHAVLPMLGIDIGCPREPMLPLEHERVLTIEARLRELEVI